MATQFGYKVLEWLKARGWTESLSQNKEVYSDPSVVDPFTHEITNIYKAVTIQKGRTGEYPDFLPKDYIDPEIVK